MMKTHAKGFTLVELMIVVSIIGTLAAVAMPAYQDYTIRAQISEGLNLASASQAAVEEYYAEHGDWPKKNGDAGLPDKKEIKGKYTKELAVKNDGIEIKYGNDAHQAIQKRKVVLTATDNNGSISWTCASDGKIEDNHLPAACRGGAKKKKKKKK
jgi:type IV pilus assembly protein PilA